MIRDAVVPIAGRAAHTTLAWLLAWAVLPALLGGLLFAAVESAQGLAPQPIRISRAGTYDPYMDDFVVFYAARFVGEHIMTLSNFYLACLWSLGCFLLMMPIGYLSFRFIEAPFLKFRRRYSIAIPSGAQAQAVAVA